jgi:nucleotide-binding universal stress UspA family protein
MPTGLPVASSERVASDTPVVSDAQTLREISARWEIPRSHKSHEPLPFSSKSPQNSEPLSGTSCAHIRESVARVFWKCAAGRRGTVMKILLAVDGSPCSDAAVEEVARRPWPEGSVVKVLNTFDLPTPPTPEGWALPLNYFEEMDAALSKQAQDVVKRAVEKLQSKLNKTVSVDGSIQAGPARALILDEAESWGADLIVVGSHGYRAWERFLLGSVSQSVVSHAKCSVEVVRCRPAEKPAEKTQLEDK